MLVIISDLHLTDSTSGETIKEGAFRVFRSRLRDLAYDASWRADGNYKPIESLDVLLLGDILDVIRSTQWLAAPRGDSGYWIVTPPICAGLPSIKLISIPALDGESTS